MVLKIDMKNNFIVINKFKTMKCLCRFFLNTLWLETAVRKSLTKKQLEIIAYRRYCPYTGCP